MDEPTLTVQFANREWIRRWGERPIEFGRGEGSGSIRLTPSDRSLVEHLHEPCGWFACDGGWLVERRRNTTNIGIVVTTGGATAELRAAQHRTLERGKGHMLLTVRGDGGREETLRVDWIVSEREYADAHAGQRTRTSLTRGPARAGVVRLSDRELAVMRHAYDYKGVRRLEHADIADALGLETRQVRRSVGKVKEKVDTFIRDHGLPPFDSSRTGNVQTVAHWLRDHGCI